MSRSAVFVFHLNLVMKSNGRGAMPVYASDIYRKQNPERQAPVSTIIADHVMPF
jgi:hypothetical protein